MDTGKIKHKIRTTIYPNKVGAINAEAHQSLLIDLVDELDAGKQDRGEGMHPDGRYPSMSVGFADNLTGHGESTPAEFSFRASGGKSIADGTARIKTLRGSSVVWNQKIDKQYISGDSVLTPRKGESLIKGHKYLLKRSRAYGACFLIPAKDVYDYFLRDNQYALIFTSAYDATSDGNYPAYPHVYCTAESGYVAVVDLTLMFGAGNEPNTIEEYNARKPIVADEYAYNEGELLHSQVDAIKSVGDNAWDEQWENGGISESNGEEFASASYIRSGYIRILPETQYYFKKPLGVLTYLYYYDSEKNFVGWADPFATSGGGGVFTTTKAAYMRFTCLQAGYSNDIMVTLVHSGWKVDTDAGYQPYWEDTLEIDPRIRAAFPDGMMVYDYAFNRNGKGVIVKATEVVDGEVAKKETPEVYEFDQPFNFDYRVADFGTEEAISSKPSAPLRADIIYQFNAVDMIRDLWARVQALEGKA